MAGLLQFLPQAAHDRCLLAGHVLDAELTGHVMRMAGVREDSPKSQPAGLPDMAGQPAYPLRCRPDPVHAGVHLDQDAELPADLPGQAAVAIGDLRGVGHQQDVGDAAHLGEPLELALSHHGIGQGQVSQPGCGHRRGLRHCGHAQACGPRGQLAAGHRDALVRLYVRPQAQPGALGERGHLGDVHLRDVQVNQHGQECPAGHPQRAGEARPWGPGGPAAQSHSQPRTAPTRRLACLPWFPRES